MDGMTIVKYPAGESQKEILKINFNKGAITAGLHIISFIDKDTKQYVLYAPSIEVSAYGETGKEANEMMIHAIKETFKYFLSLGKKTADQELYKLGWKHNEVFKKEYSKAHVDVSGILQGFNAEENSIEHLQLTAA